MIDQEKTMNEVHNLAAEARQAGGAQTGRVTNDGSHIEELSTNKVAAPIFLGQERDIIPEKYIIHYSFVQCKNCGNATRESQFYGLVYIKSRMGGTRVRQLVPCTRAVYNVPVERILTGQHKIPFCEWCHQEGKIDLSHLPPPPEPTLVTNFPDVLPKWQKPRPASEPKASKEPKKPATLDDLI